MAGKPSVTSHFLKLLRRARCFKMRVMYLYILLHIHTVHMYIIDDIRYIACIYIYYSLLFIWFGFKSIRVKTEGT